MSTETYNRVQIFYNEEHKPYVYGMAHIVDGSPENHRYEKPFVVSRRNADGEEIVYGTIQRTLEKISQQIDKLKRFQSDTALKLDAAGMTPLIQDDSTLPDSELTDRILDEQENLVEDILLAISVHIRILSEIFPQKIRRSKVNVYDYDDVRIDAIELSEIANLLIHNRYILVRDDYVVDLFSDQKFMVGKPQMGLKINFLEYIQEVEKAIDGITVKDLIGKLWGYTENLAASSNIKDIIFLHQNLYTLGGSAVGNRTPIESGPLKTILDRVATKYLGKMYPQNSGAVQTSIGLTFRTPRFYIEPDLDRKQIRVEMQVNDSPETLIMDYKKFFSEVSKASGKIKLHASNE